MEKKEKKGKGKGEVANGSVRRIKNSQQNFPNTEANEIKSSFDNPLINFPLKNQ